MSRPVGYRVLAPVVGVLMFFGLWELLVQTFDIRPFVLRAPSSYLPHIADNLDTYVEATALTAGRALAALVIAAAVSLLIGAVLSATRFFEEAANPVLVLVQVTPFVLYITSVKLWLGSSTATILFISSLVCAPAFVFATVQGLRSADPATVELLRSVDASRWEMFRRLRLPSALPGLFTAARYDIGLALIAVYLTEGGSQALRGLGVIGRRTAGLDPDPQWATVFCMALLGSLGLLLVGLTERLLLTWHASQREPTGSGRYRAQS